MKEEFLSFYASFAGIKVTRKSTKKHRLAWWSVYVWLIHRFFVPSVFIDAAIKGPCYTNTVLEDKASSQLAHGGVLVV